MDAGVVVEGAEEAVRSGVVLGGRLVVEEAGMLVGGAGQDTWHGLADLASQVYVRADQRASRTDAAEGP